MKTYKELEGEFNDAIGKLRKECKHPSNKCMWETVFGIPDGEYKEYICTICEAVLKYEDPSSREIVDATEEDFWTIQRKRLREKNKFIKFE